MDNIWAGNLQTSILVGLALFAFLFIPLLIWQYRHHGAWNFARMFGGAMVCLYSTALIVYTLLPFPDDRLAWCATHRVKPNFTPFNFLDDIARETAGMSTFQAATSRVVLQVVFNVVLFIPFGIIARRYFHFGIIRSAILGLFTTLLIETTQYTAFFGLLPCAYRVADVDDIMANALGGLTGALIAPMLLWWMPEARALAARRLDPRPVTARRRWLGMLLDGLFFHIIMIITAIITRMASTLLAGTTDIPHATAELVLPPVMGCLLVFIIPAARSRGASIGQTIVWLTPKWLSADRTHLTDATLARRLVRSLVVVGPSVLASISGSLILNQIWGWTLSIPTFLVIFAALVMVPASRTHRSLSGWLTGAVFVDAREPIAGGPANKQIAALSESDLAQLFPNQIRG